MELFYSSSPPKKKQHLLKKRYHIFMVSWNEKSRKKTYKHTQKYKNIINVVLKYTRFFWFCLFFSPRDGPWELGTLQEPTIMATAGTNSWPEKSDGKKISGRSSPSPIFLVKLDGTVLKIGYPPWNWHFRIENGWLEYFLVSFLGPGPFSGENLLLNFREGICHFDVNLVGTRDFLTWEFQFFFYKLRMEIEQPPMLKNDTEWHVHVGLVYLLTYI